MTEFYGDDDDFDWTLPPEMVAAGVVTTTTSTTAFSSSSNNNKNTNSGWSGKPVTTATTTTVKSINGNSNNHGWPSEDGWPDDDSFDWAAKPTTSNPVAKTTGPATPNNISKIDCNTSFNDWAATPETAPVPKKKAKTPKKQKEKLDELPAKTPATKNELPVEEVEKSRAMAAIKQQFGPPLNQNSKPPANNASNANKEPLQAGSFRPLPDCCSPRPYLALKHEQVVVLKVLKHQAEENDPKKKKSEGPKKGAISLNWRELIDLETFTPLPETKFAAVEDPVESQLYLSWYANWKRWKEGQQSKPQQQQQQQQLQMTTNVTEQDISFSANIRTTPIPSISPIQRASSSPSSSPFVHRAAFTATVSYENDQQAATTTTTTTCVQAQSSQQFRIGGASEPTKMKIKDTKEEDAQKVRSLTSRVNCGGGNLLEALEDQEEAGDPTPVLVPLKVSSRVVVIGGTPPRMTTTTTANWSSSTSPSSSLHHQSQVRLVS